MLTAVFAVPALGETLEPGELAGGAVVLAGILLVHRSQQRRAEGAAAASVPNA